MWPWHEELQDRDRGVDLNLLNEDLVRGIRLATETCLLGNKEAEDFLPFHVLLLRKEVSSEDATRATLSVRGTQFVV